MIRLTIDNSYSNISGLNLEQTKQLRDILSYSKTNYFAGNYNSRKRCLMSKRGDFPSGLLSLVYKYMQHTGYELLDRRIRPIRLQNGLKMKFEGVPYKGQLDAVTACSRHHRGAICMPTGTGKSITMALLVNLLQVKTLIVVPNIELKNQLTNTFKSLFGNLSHITICNIDSSELKTAKDYDCLIIDEAHHVAAKTYRDLNKKVWNGIYYRFFFTATPFRSKDEEQLLYESVAGQVIYRISYAESVKNRYIVPMECYYIELPKTKTNKTAWAGVYSDLVVNNEYRNGIIHDLLLKSHANKLSTLCLVKEIQHGKLISYEGAFPFVNGQNDERYLIEAFTDRKINVLIGTTGVLGAGVDTKPAEYVIIAGLGKSKNAFMQQVGRGFRNYPGKESCKIILFYDPSHKWTKAHFKAQCKYLDEEYGVKPIKITID